MHTEVQRRLICAAFVALGLGLGMAQSPGVERPPYRRSEWQHWIDADGDCENTRIEVLVEEVMLLDPDGDGSGLGAEWTCRAVFGRWFDPYGGEFVTSPGALDIDHVVPLKFAHEHGGWKWSRTKKRAYANDLSDPDHLIAVSARLNRQKGEKGPDRWVPPRRASHCRYGRAWERITTRWGLRLHAAERQAITTLLATCAAR